MGKNLLLKLNCLGIVIGLDIQVFVYGSNLLKLEGEGSKKIYC